ncbi:hypothetical protein F4859DRAFT_526667 [Xylaria cf. heliscus]|nr:hypothetical protein F4859DRAFT_526667 [Xylaria cf. heliscus]
MTSNIANKYFLNDFELDVSPQARITGKYITPPRTSLSPQNLPLLVGIHGGTLTSSYYDADPNYSAAKFAIAFGIPFVAIDRPCYNGTTSILPLQEGESFFWKTATRLNGDILPALWQKFGIPNGCIGMVTLSHSMAVPIAILTAYMHAKTGEQLYPLKGIIISGFGSQWADPEELRSPSGAQLPTEIEYPQDTKKKLMLSADHFNTHDPGIEKYLQLLSVPMPVEELLDLQLHWATYGPHCATEVVVPVMYALGEHDFLWVANRTTISNFGANFTQCRRFDGGVVLGAPHAIEWSKARVGWYTRCFSWAMEICS